MLAETVSALGSNVAVVSAALVVAVCSFHNNWQLTNVLWVLIWLPVLLGRVMDRVLWAAVELSLFTRGKGGGHSGTLFR